LKLLPLSNAKSSQHDKTLKTVSLLAEAKVERLIRKYRDFKIQSLQAQSLKQATTRALHKHVAMRTTDKATRSHKEEQKSQYRDASIAEEYQREARTLMISVEADKGEQIERTEKLIFELSHVLQQFSLKVHEQEAVSILSKINTNNYLVS
jgi:hypothetical protein